RTGAERNRVGSGCDGVGAERCGERSRRTCAAAECGVAVAGKGTSADRHRAGRHRAAADGDGVASSGGCIEADCDRARLGTMMLSDAVGKPLPGGRYRGNLDPKMMKWLLLGHCCAGGPRGRTSYDYALSPQRKGDAGRDSFRFPTTPKTNGGPVMADALIAVALATGADLAAMSRRRAPCAAHRHHRNDARRSATRLAGRPHHNRRKSSMRAAPTY